ncbi:hypothetical protein [Halorientalis salina]|uniref:hypothetical protein n=1 Tax=Halorientalis salina TaxID=2932266 RepID=UPI0010ACADE4|nr:hypothetical protein [Halorientalis salina]
MIRSLYRRIREWASRDEEAPFAGSELDRSVNYSHDGAGGEGERELERAQKEAEKLTEVQQER